VQGASILRMQPKDREVPSLLHNDNLVRDNFGYSSVGDKETK